MDNRPEPKYPTVQQTFYISKNTMHQLGCLTSDSVYIGSPWDNMKTFYVQITNDGFRSLNLHVLYDSSVKNIHARVTFRLSQEGRQIVERTETTSGRCPLMPWGRISCLDVISEDRILNCESTKITTTIEILSEMWVCVELCKSFFTPEYESAAEAKRLRLTDPSDVVVITCGESEFKARKSVLSRASNVFRAMFKHEMSENKLNRLNIVDIEPSIVKTMLAFVEGGRSNCAIGGNAIEIFVAADKYDMPELRMACIDTIINCLHMFSFESVMELSAMYSCRELKMRVLEEIARTIYWLSETDFWTYLSKHPELSFEILTYIAKQNNPERLFISDWKVGSNLNHVIKN